MKVLAPFLIDSGIPKMDVNFACDMDEMIELAIDHNLVHPDDVQQRPRKVPALPCKTIKKVRVQVMQRIRNNIENKLFRLFSMSRIMLSRYYAITLQ